MQGANPRRQKGVLMKKTLCFTFLLASATAIAMENTPGIINCALKALEKEYYQCRTMHLLAKKTLIHHMAQKTLNPETIKQLIVGLYTGPHFFRLIGEKSEKKQKKPHHPLKMQDICFFETKKIDFVFEDPQKALERETNWMKGGWLRYSVFYPFSNSQQQYFFSIPEPNKLICKKTKLKAKHVEKLLEQHMEPKKLPPTPFERLSINQKKKLSEIINCIIDGTYKDSDSSPEESPALKTAQKSLEEKILELKKKVMPTLPSRNKMLTAEKLSDITIVTQT